MLILLHAAVHLLAGAFYAQAAPRNSSRGGHGVIWRLAAALYVDLLTAAPLVAYQCRLWPAYAFGYAIDPLLSPWIETFAPLVAFAALMAMPSAFSLGFLLTTLAKRRERHVLSRFFVLFCLVSVAALLGWHYEEFTVIGDFPIYWRGGGTPASRHVHVQLLLSAYVANAVAIVLFVRRRALRLTSDGT